MRLVPEVEAREHHYRFAHRYLAVIAFKSPDRLQNELHLKGESMLLDAWKSVGKDLPRKQRVAPDGLHLDWAPFGLREVALITLPPPIATPEAYFVAIVFGGALMPDVFTLEHADDIETGEPYTVLGEWKVDGTHVNHGRGPQPDKAEMVQTILAHLGLDGDGAGASG